MNQARLTEATLRVLRTFMKAPDRKWSGAQIGRETGMGPGSRYPILRRLEEAGWLEGQWEDIDPRQAGRPRSRFYGLTELGRVEALAALQKRAAREWTPPAGADMEARREEDHGGRLVWRNSPR